ncbi:MAG: ParM/StbA family protein [Acidiferrobacteraceae bacterium]
MSIESFVVGLDIGYSNLKVAWGTSKAVMPSTHLAPSGCGPLAQLSERIGAEGGASLNGAARVWRALFLAALQVAGRERVDLLVTGLPVSHYQNAALRERLRHFLVGTHQVAPSREVKVARAQILAQPAGAYLDRLSAPPPGLLDIVEHGRTVIVDPGYFSVDWLVLEGGDIHRGSSGTRLKSMQALLHGACALMAEALGSAPTEERLEDALRSGQDKILVHGQWVSLVPYVNQAGRAVAAKALTELRSTLRGDAGAVDAVLITGGGASFYEAAVREAFPKSRLVVSRESALAYARGFWWYGNH